VPELRRRSNVIKKLPLLGAAATRSTSPAGRAFPAACRRASICSTSPTKSTPSWWCCRLSSVSGCRFKHAELKPFISAQNKRSFLFLYAAVAFRAHRARASGCCGAVGLRMLASARLRMVNSQNSGWRPPADMATSPARDISAHLKSARFPIRQRRCCAMLLALPDEVLVTRRDELERCDCPCRAFRWDEDSIARHPAQERSRRRPRQHHTKANLRGLPGAARARGSARLKPPFKACWSARVEKNGVEDHRRHMQDATFGPMIMVGFWRPSHGVV